MVAAWLKPQLDAAEVVSVLSANCRPTFWKFTPVVLKNDWSNPMYRAVCLRVISHSIPTVGACAWATLVVQYVNIPPLTPQNHEFVKFEPGCCASPTAGISASEASPERRPRLSRM